ncbi:Lysophosphatidylserine lipase ABHD12 [Sarcoptes scabiei]|uniref:Monoacylglycerol lipase ABHD12 n=1 Tax=Sarcoptes scabiei TaxID=52283 RepID=A0A834VEA5_SARSC|nr:Lysophosphatidylserine lipase ABHD12 [Sarcoptes scabiei]
MNSSNKIRKRSYLDQNFGPNQSINYEKNDEKMSKTKIDKFDVSHQSSILKRIFSITLLLFCFLAFLIFVLIPIFFRYSQSFQRSILFMNFANLHYLYNVTNPKEFSMNCTRSMFLQSDANISLGVWHIKPNEEDCTNENEFNFDDNLPVILYAHGNAGTRANKRRIALYKVLSNQFGSHLITFDYRSFGDSSHHIKPTAQGLVNDTRFIYEWLLNQNVKPKRILLWGHSLGTAVVLQFLAQNKFESYPSGAILEAPFTSIDEATKSYPLSKYFRWLPYFDHCFIEPLIMNNETNFNSTAKLSSIHCPLLILHATDDNIIPYQIGQRLHQQAISLQPKYVLPAKLILYSSDLGYGHKHIFKDPNLSRTVRNFYESLN